MKSRFLPVSAFCLLIGVVAYQTDAFSQRPVRNFAEMSKRAEATGLADAYKGITKDGTVEPGLFSIRSTGVTTEPMRKAADAFVATLTEEQRKKTVFPVDDPEWRKWMNQHFYIRQGVSFLEMSEPQRNAAIAMMRASLSAKGLNLTLDIMKLNETLGELNNNDFEQYGEKKYWVTIMGKPSKDQPWGWQLDGHHAIINYFVLGDQVVATPMFTGSEPVIAPSGKYKGLKILQEEQAKGYDFLMALNEQQRSKAVLQVSKNGNNNLTEAFKDNVVLDYAGVRAADLDAKQKAQLLQLVQLYVGNMDDGHARVKMDEVKKHIDRTYFAWIGGSEPGGVYYYRIHSPVVLIEFDHQSPVGIRHLMEDKTKPFREHIHTVMRTPNGNDYGKDLLRQHYLKYPHSN